MERTLCINDPKLPVYSIEALEADGWSGFGEYVISDETLCFKGDQMGFFNRRTGHLVTCDYNPKLETIFLQRDKEERKIQEAIKRQIRILFLLLRSGGAK